MDGYEQERSEGTAPIPIEAWHRPLRNDLVASLMLAFDAEEFEGEQHDTPRLAEALLRDAVREGATDIHLDTQLNGMLVRLRVDGRVLDGVFLDTLDSWWQSEQETSGDDTGLPFRGNLLALAHEYHH